MICSISHRIAVEPVVSKVCGCVYEESLINAYIKEHGCCPITGESLTLSDLIKIRNSGEHNELSNDVNTSVSSLLERFRNEWIAITLEQFESRKRIAQLEQELEYATKRYEAACHVIASLTSNSQANGNNDSNSKKS